MRKDDSRSIKLKTAFDHFPGIHRRAIYSASEHFLVTDHSVLAIQKDNAEYLVLSVRKFDLKKTTNVFG
jgi:hypothetical protein